MSYAAQYFEEAAKILSLLDQSAVERTVDLLLELRERSGRLFLLGVGGGAGHASHAVCDFRKIAQIEAYAKSNISTNLVKALEHARDVSATICGVVGRDGGYTKQVADACVLVPVVNPSTITPHTESFQAMVWHLLVSHPKLKLGEMKWESVQSPALS
jgi:D-sedoheptulose 7-phosphate isomerase